MIQFHLFKVLLIVSILLNAFQFYIYISNGCQRPARQQPISNRSNTSSYSEIIIFLLLYFIIQFHLFEVPLIVSMLLAFQFYIYISNGCQRPARQQPISNRSNTSSYSEILTSNYSDLVTGIRSCVETLAEAAYTRKLIPRQILDEVLTTQPQRWKANILLLAIQDKIKVNPSSFSTFLDVLHSDPALEDLAGILHNGANMSGHNHP